MKVLLDTLYENTKTITLGKDIPTLGIAFTIIDNWCSDHMIDEPKINDIDHPYNDELLIYCDTYMFTIK